MLKFIHASAFACILGLIVSGSPAICAEQGVLTDARAICIATHGDPDRALKAAEAAGWQTLPGVTPQQNAEFEAQTGERARRKANHLLVVGVGQNMLPVDLTPERQARLKVCTVTEMPSHADIKAVIQAYVGAPPTLDRGDNWSWAFVEKDGQRRQISSFDDASFEPSLDDGAFTAIMAEKIEGKSVTVTYVAVTPVGEKN